MAISALGSGPLFGDGVMVRRNGPGDRRRPARVPITSQLPKVFLNARGLSEFDPEPARDRLSPVTELIYMHRPLEFPRGPGPLPRLDSRGSWGLKRFRRRM